MSNKVIKNKKNKKKGFTLIELIVVIAILGVTSIISVVSLSSVQKRTREKEYEAVKNSIKAAALTFKETTGLGVFYVQSLIDYGILSADNSGKILNPIDSSEMNCYIVSIDDNNIYELKENSTCNDDLYKETSPVISVCANECNKCKKSDWSVYQLKNQWTNVDALCFKAELSLDKLNITDYAWTYSQDYNFSSTDDNLELKFNGTQFSKDVFRGKFNLSLGLSDPTIKAASVNFEVNNDKSKPEVTTTTAVNCGNGAKINVSVKDAGSGISKIYYVDTSRKTNITTVSGAPLTNDFTKDGLKTTGYYTIYAEDKSGNYSDENSVYLDATKKDISLGIEVQNQSGTEVKSGDKTNSGIKFRFSSTTWGHKDCAGEIRYYVSDSDGNYDNSKTSTVVPLNNINSWITDYSSKKDTFYIFYKATNKDNISKTGKFKVTIQDETKVSAPELYRYELITSFRPVYAYASYNRVTFLNSVATTWDQYDKDVQIKLLLNSSAKGTSTIADNYKLGESKAVSFKINLKNEDEKVELIVGGSSISFRVPRRGDVNGDGYVNQDDKNLANDYYYNHTVYLTSSQKKLLDVNCDGKYNSDDADDLNNDKIAKNCDLDQEVEVIVKFAPIKLDGYIHITDLSLSIVQKLSAGTWTKNPLLVKSNPLTISYKNYNHTGYNYQYNGSELVTTKSNYYTLTGQTVAAGYTFKSKDVGISTSTNEEFSSTYGSTTLYIDKTPPTYSTRSINSNDIYKMFATAQCWQTGSDDWKDGAKHSNVYPISYKNFGQKSVDNVKCGGTAGHQHHVDGVTTPIYFYIHFPVKVTVDNTNRVITAHFCQFHDNMSYYGSYFNSNEFNDNELPYTDALSGLQSISTYTISSERCSYKNGKDYCGSSGSPTYWDYKQVAYDNAHNLFQGYDVRLITHYYNWDETANDRERTSFYNANDAFNCDSINVADRQDAIVIGEKLVYKNGAWESAGTCRNSECTLARYENGTFPNTARVFD